jgi:hypothetical protein
MDDRGIGVRFSIGPQTFSSLHINLTASGFHLASYPVGTGAYLPVLKADSLLLSSAKVKNEWSYTSIPVNVWRAPNLGKGKTFLSEFSVIYFNVTEWAADLNESYLLYCGSFCDQRKVHEADKLLHLITDYFVERM